MTDGILAAAAVSFATSALITFGVLRAALRRQILIDAPNERSSHERPKPRGGGAGVVGGLAIGLAIASSGLSWGDAVIPLLLSALACAALGFLDDVRGLKVTPRLTAQFAIATWLVSQTGPLQHLPLPTPLDWPLGILGYAFPVIWLVGVTNFFNFMDGIDGLAAGQAIVVCLAIAAAAWSHDAVWIALLMTGALLGFLPFNWWPSRIFLGDVGSLPVGFLLAGLPLLAPDPERPRAVLAVAVGLTLFLLDPVLTLWRRWRRGAPLGRAHREHLYQQFLGPKDPHATAASLLIGAGLALSIAGWALYRWPSFGWPAILGATLVFAAENHLAHKRTPR